MLDKIEKLSKVLNESYSEKTLRNSLGTFFAENFQVKNFKLEISEQVFSSENNDTCKYFKYPLMKHKKNIGYLCFSSASDSLNEFLKYTSQFISIKVQNILLNDKMQRNINFHETMKDIVKIIETQYELKYIIPIIGEMLDKFFENYLIYIFLNDEKKNIKQLSWPSACNDKNILSLVEETNTKYLAYDKKIYIAPLTSEGKNVGLLVTKSMSEEISEKNMEYLSQLAAQIATTINRANVYGEILKHATLDALTGFYNRRQLEERIKQEVSNAKRQKAPLCGIMTDIDFFKNVNDTYGHAVGDLVLRTIAKIIRGQLREYDIAGRYGGEEFSLLLPFTQIDEAKMVAERLRKLIENKKINISKVNSDVDTKCISVTLSLGIYEMKENDKDEDLLRKADKALYQAKNTGRNKVVVYNE